MRKKVAFFPSDFPENLQVTILPHPRTQKQCPFVIKNSQIFEILEISNTSSFFIGDEVVSDGNALLASRIHPLFLALPLICSRGPKEMYPLKEYFIDTPLEKIQDLIIPYIHLACSEVNYGDMTVWFYDEEKTLNWLYAQCTKILPFLRSFTTQEDKILIEHAWDILRHYLNSSLAQKLKEFLMEKVSGSFAISRFNSIFCQSKSTDTNESKPHSQKQSQKKSPSNKTKQREKTKTATKANENKKTKTKKKSEPKPSKNSLDMFVVREKR